MPRRYWAATDDEAMNYTYILDETGKPIAEPDLDKWGEWMQTPARIVAKDRIADSEVSTVFLGMDHAWGGGPPVLWETMVFGGRLNQAQSRCSGSKEQAEAMHATMVEKVRAHQLR